MFSPGSGTGIHIAITASATAVHTALSGIRSHASSALAGLTGLSSGVAGVGGVAAAQAPSIGNFFNQFLGANLAMSALSKVQQGVGAVFGKIQEAMAFQTQSMSLAGDIGTNLGLSFKEANASVLDIQKQIAKEAAVLPGVTKQYNDVFNALGGSVAKVFPQDLPKFREAVTDVTKRVGMLAAVKHVDATEAGVAVNRAISGTTGLGELMQMALFERSPQFTATLRAEVAKAGLDMKDWKNTTDQIRLGIIRRSLSAATPDSMIGEFEGTVESLWQGIQTRVNDPLVGMFGFLRDIPSLNNTTVMDAVKDFLSAFVRMTTQFGVMAKDLGIDFDPLAPIARFIRWMATVQYAIGAAFEYRTFNLSHIFDFEGITKGIGNFVNRAARAAFRVLEGINVLDGMKGITALLTTLPELLSKMFQSINWANLGFLLGAFLSKFLISWSASLPAALLSFGKLFFNVLWGIGGLLTGVLLGLFYGFFIEPIKGAVSKVTDPIVSFFTWISDGIKALWDKVKGLVDGAGRMLGLPGMAVQGVVSAASAGMDLANTLKTNGGNILDAGKALASKALNAITGKPNDPTTKAATEAVKAVQGGQLGVGGKLPGIDKPTIPGVSGVITPSNAATPVQPSAPSVAPKAMAMVDTVVNPLSAPENLTGLPGVTPIGSGLPGADAVAMADTVLPLPTAPTASTVQSNTFAPQINVPVTKGDIDTDKLIATVTNYLERQYSDFKRGRLGVAV